MGKQMSLLEMAPKSKRKEKEGKSMPQSWQAHRLAYKRTLERFGITQREIFLRSQMLEYQDSSRFRLKWAHHLSRWLSGLCEVSIETVETWEACLAFGRNGDVVLEHYLNQISAKNDYLEVAQAAEEHWRKTKSHPPELPDYYYRN